MPKILSKSKMCRYCLVDIAKGLFNGMIGNYLLYFFQSTVKSGLPNLLPQNKLLGFITVMALITGIGKIVDAVTDPLVASLSDKCNHKDGRRMPFLRYAALPYALSLLLIFYAPFGENSVLNAVWVGFFLVAYYVSYTFFFIPPNADATPMGYIMEFSDKSIDIHRMNFAYDDMGYEEKQDMLWNIALPYENDGKYSFESRKAKNMAPEISSAEATVETKDDKIVLTFPAGSDDDFVHSYKVVVDDNDIKYFFSDFYNGLDDMKDTVELELDNDGKLHNYKIYAVDSWGEESNTCITAQN